MYLISFGGYQEDIVVVGCQLCLLKYKRKIDKVISNISSSAVCKAVTQSNPSNARHDEKPKICIQVFLEL